LSSKALLNSTWNLFSSALGYTWSKYCQGKHLCLCIISYFYNTHGALHMSIHSTKLCGTNDWKEAVRVGKEKLPPLHYLVGVKIKFL
jgi:hypothetical protein